MEKEIRILTGLHAGARMRLAEGNWRIGNEDSADVQITDWQHAAVTLRIHENGNATWTESCSDAPGIALAELLPIRFEEIALCVGDPAKAWPDDTALLDTLRPPVTSEAADLSKPAPTPATTRRPKGWQVFSGGFVLAVACAGTVLLTEQPSHAKALPSSELMLRRVNELLPRLNQNELEAVAQGDLIVVRGLVGSSADAIAVRQMLDKVAPSRSLTDIANVRDVIANIQESLRDSALKVSYAGKGQFLVTGSARNPAAVEKTVAQIEKDFGAGVKRIQVKLTQQRRSWPIADSNSALVADSLQYVQSQDGSKHFLAAGD